MCMSVYGKERKKIYRGKKKLRKKLKPRIFAHLLQLCTLVSVNRARGFGAYFENRHSLRSLPHTQHTVFYILLVDFFSVCHSQNGKNTSKIVRLTVRNCEEEKLSSLCRNLNDTNLIVFLSASFSL